MNPVFAVLSDPTRRDILGRLSRNGPSTSTRLSGDLGITRQAVAKHLALLADAGLATRTRTGRESHYAADLDALIMVSSWIDDVRADWKQRLDLLAASLDQGSSAS